MRHIPRMHASRHTYACILRRMYMTCPTHGLRQRVTYSVRGCADLQYVPTHVPDTADNDIKDAENHSKTIKEPPLGARPWCTAACFAFQPLTPSGGGLPSEANFPSARLPAPQAASLDTAEPSKFPAYRSSVTAPGSVFGSGRADRCICAVFPTFLTWRAPAELL